ncbi:MAG TPA: type VI secretion system-associated protein TagF [Paraburkholderia sp.]|uniref:type VI secretion system-associated protein TagF n=1 Tax=Paraburkholderia sp. TaxID=1926495 RepID=UPI002ED21490
MNEVLVQAPGFFGKVRTHGDFVTRRLPAGFVTPWDEALQKGMLFAQQVFGAQWVSVYLAAPLWCFALRAGVCGQMAWAGVLMPGVDRVGRYFPFTIALPIPDDDLMQWLKGAGAWFDCAARLALSTLDDDFVLERFDEALQELVVAQTVVEAWPWGVVASDRSGATEAFVDVLCARMTARRSAWWSNGSDTMPPTLRIAAGLPDEQCFASLLDTADAQWEWTARLYSGHEATGCGPRDPE